MHFGTAAVIFLVSLFSYTNAATLLTVSNDGPAIIPASITFYARLDHAYDQYIYEFQDLSNFNYVKNVRGYDNAKASFTFDDGRGEADDYELIVRVWFTIFGNKAWTIATAKCKYQLKSSLVGDLVLQQNGTDSDVLSKGLLASGPANVSLQLHDPTGYFINYTVTYNWTISRVENHSLTPVLNYTFPKGNTVVTLVAKGVGQDNHTLFGEFYRNVTAIDAISRINVVGKTFLTRDRNLDLNVTCGSGSGPFAFCKKVFFGNATALQNFSCPIPVDVSDACKFHVSWYFRNKGTYYLGIKTMNEVSSSVNKFEISVLDINKQAQLSFVIIPVGSSILAILIIMIGLAYHVKQRQTYTVEVADFDFLHRENLNEKTFVERVKESFTNSFGGHSLSGIMHSNSGQTPYDNLSEFENDLADRRPNVESA